MLGKWGEVCLKCSSWGSGVSGKGDSPVLVDSGGKREGKDASYTFKVGGSKHL